MGTKMPSLAGSLRLKYLKRDIARLDTKAAESFHVSPQSHVEDLLRMSTLSTIMRTNIVHFLDRMKRTIKITAKFSGFTVYKEIFTENFFRRHKCQCNFMQTKIYVGSYLLVSQLTEINLSYFLENMPLLLFISTLPQCGVYLRPALIRGRCLIPLRVFTCNPVPSSFMRQFPTDAMTDCEEFVFICSFMCTSLLGSLS